MLTKGEVLAQAILSLPVVEKIKAGLIHNAKVKRAYYRTLKREEKDGVLATNPPIEGDNEVQLQFAL